MNLLQKISSVLLMVNFAMGANTNLKQALTTKTTFDVAKIANTDNFVEFLNSFIEMQKISFDDKNKYNEIIIPGLLKISDINDPKYKTENSFDKTKIFDASGKLLPAAAAAFEEATKHLPQHVKIDDKTDLTKLKADFDALYKEQIQNTLINKKVDITKAEDISRYLQVLNFLNTIVKDQIFDATQYVGAVGSATAGKFDMANFLETDAAQKPKVLGLSTLGLKLINDTLTKLKIKDGAGSAALQLAAGEVKDFVKINGAMTSIFDEALKLEVKDGFIVDKSNPILKRTENTGTDAEPESKTEQERSTIEIKQMPWMKYVTWQGLGSKEKQVGEKKIRVKALKEDGKEVEYEININKQGLAIIGEVVSGGLIILGVYKISNKNDNSSQQINENNDQIVE